MKKKITYEEGMRELESLVCALEEGKMTLEESFKSYEKAVQLKGALDALLEEGDRRIRVLTETGEQEMAEESVK